MAVVACGKSTGGTGGNGGSIGPDAGSVDAPTGKGGQGSGGLLSAGGMPGLGGAVGLGGKPALGGAPGSGGMAGTGGKTAFDGGPEVGKPEVGGIDASTKDSPVMDVGRKDMPSELGGDTGASSSLTVWLAGDSTMANGSTPCPVGWGKQFQALFDGKVKVVNSAQGGRSVQTWLYDVSDTMGSDGECKLASTTTLSAWTAMLDGMKTGDYLFIQFGINDGDSSCDRHVGTTLFKTYLGMMAEAAKERGANPIFVTPVSSISCSGSTAKGSRGTYATATKDAGKTYAVPVIDLEQLSVALYNSLGFCPLPGPDNSTTFASGAIGDFFCEDHTHFEAAGATQIAKLVAKALKDQGIGLADHLQ
jgi:lysophospholipase L1-like esterase